MPENHNEIVEKDIITKKIENIASKWRQIIMVAVVVIVVVAIYGIIATQQEKAEKNAWKETAEALISKNTKDKLSDVIEEYPGTEALTFATLQLIKQHFDANEITKARLVAKDFLKKNPDNYFSEQVRVEYAKLLEWEAKWKEAKEEYSKVKQEYLKPEAMLGVARCLEQENKNDEAMAEYNKIIALSDKEGWSQSIRNIKEIASFRIAAIKSRKNLLADNSSIVNEKQLEKIEKKTVSEKAEQK